MFEITTDPPRRFLRIAMRGFWDAGTMTAYSKAVRTALGTLQQGGGCGFILIDMLDYPIQSKAVAEGHADNLRIVKARGAARVALVMQSALSRLQAARVAADTGHATFPSEDAALAWLFSDAPPPA